MTPESLESPGQWPICTPKVEIDQPPEVLGLGYQVVIDPEALGEEMKRMGFEDDQIGKAKICINYQQGIPDRGLALLTGQEVYGRTDALTGTPFIKAGIIIKDGRKWEEEFNQVLNGLPCSRSKEALRVLQRKIGNWILSQALPEKKVIKEHETPRVLPFELARSYGEIARWSVSNAISEEEVLEIKKVWGAFVEGVVQKTIEHNLRLVLGHELNHSQHYNIKEPLKALGVGIPLAFLYIKTVDVLVSQIVVLAQHFDAKISPQAENVIWWAIILGGYIPVTAKIAWVLKKWVVTGEKEAYQEGANLVDRFSRVISVEKIGS
jgi:hypothetical protein